MPFCYLSYIKYDLSCSFDEMTFALDFCAIAQKRFFEPLFLLNFEFVTEPSYRNENFA